jgi:hypothetical protein
MFAYPAAELLPLKVMIENRNGRRGARITIWLVVSAVLVILALIVVPPFISIRRYQSRITQVISASVGRPVRLSSVELRLLPRPSFVLTDLSVEEDPAYGAEPVIHASTVKASIRLLPLWWRARLEISRISVDEASLNLVRTGTGQWNLDSFFRTAATRAGAGGGSEGAMPFPYLEATDSRVNIKDGVEKLPYSLVNADLSFWQETPGEWRIRLKGQPARTDVNLDLADTGVVRLEGRMQRGPDLHHMPIHLDVDWRNAQLGQRRLAWGPRRRNPCGRNRGNREAHRQATHFWSPPCGVHPHLTHGFRRELQPYLPPVDPQPGKAAV